MEHKKGPPTTDTSGVSVIIRGLCLTSSGTAKESSSVPATCTVPTIGRRCWRGRYASTGVQRYFRADAAFARPEVYELLEEQGFLYAIRLPTNDVLERELQHLLKRPVRRPVCVNRKWTHLIIENETTLCY